MRTHILVPITVVILALSALGVIVFSVMQSPPIQASNAILVAPAPSAPSEDLASSTPRLPEASVATSSSSTSTSTLVPSTASSSPSSGVVGKGCVIDGCSNTICRDASAPSQITTCEYKSEYECYKKVGRCEVQSSGHCGWSDTKELAACMSSHANTSVQ